MAFLFLLGSMVVENQYPTRSGTPSLFGCGYAALWSVPEPLALSAEQRRTLETWISARNTPQKVVFRSPIVLLAASGQPNGRIARQVKTSRPTVVLWRNRFASGGPLALAEDEPGRGRKPVISAEKVKQIVAATLHSHPAARRIGACGQWHPLKASARPRYNESGMRTVCSRTGARRLSCHAISASSRS